MKYQAADEYHTGQTQGTHVGVCGCEQMPKHNTPKVLAPLPTTRHQEFPLHRLWADGGVWFSLGTQH